MLAANASSACAPGDGGANLTRADMEKLLLGMEERRISKISIQLSADRATIDRHDETIQQMETSLNDMQTRLMKVESTCEAITRENEALKLKTDDLENKSRRNNLRITGISERAEGPRPTTFIEDCLKEIFGPDALPFPLVVDRAHRVAVQRRGPADPPRPFIARIHHYQSKEAS